MINREQFKAELDSVDDLTIDILHSVMVALKQKTTASTNHLDWSINNPLKNSIVHENDVLSPSSEAWDAEQ
ncbi:MULTISPECIES: hypothetical protein [Synechocystis]|uniref:Uncharacterized protein n=1 Tax=Synechocystis salina LEGE 00031 TaxID=1828736 RepID=A0ABR9VPY6_9SYNC|nr:MULTISPECIES: hypothetical protein [Synechocystis]MBE9195554.1 hypothetical protein [Synechocystis sp. LEGE 06083]MBE9240230.1 hypothetical protein [Synechocystis salina LEGE 00041]MBE9253404.1 hypothetical protein [Synechocystis salina LEGE 00031]